MDENSFRGVNLNLLVVFAVLVRERSTTRTAERLLLSQPAVSHSLKRLRALFADELFTRASQGLVPTARAQCLYEEILPALKSIELTLPQQPSAANRTAATSLAVAVA